MLCLGHQPFVAKEQGMPTGKKASSAASKELRSSKSSKNEKTVAGSDLAQAKSKGKPRKKK
jgi:hypothetical protein